MSNFSRWQSGTALLMVLGMTAGAAMPIVIPATTFAQTANFTDLQSDYWAKGFIEALAAKEIIKGFPDGSFRPNEPVTRAEFAAMILKAFKKPKVRNDATFVDVPQNHWAFSAIQEANRTGFLTGYPGNVFRPNQDIPRVQVLVALANGLSYATGGSTTIVLQKFYRDAASIPEFARNSVAAATEKAIVVNYPDINILNPNRSATRSEVAASIYQALVNAGEAQAISSPFIVGFRGGEEAKDDIAETSSGKPVTIEVLKNDTPTEGTGLTIAQVTKAGNGSVAIAADKKSVTYTPNPGVAGVTDNFTYTISNDEGGTTTAKVTVTVGSSPLAAKADTTKTQSGKPVTIPVLDNDSGPAGASLTVTDVTSPSNGKAEIANAGKNVLYTPNPGFSGTTDNFIYTISDGKGNTATAPVTVTVELASLEAVEDKASVPQGKKVTIDVLANDRAPAGASLTVKITQPPANGIAAIAPDKKSVTYTPNPGVTAGTTDSFIYTISDGSNTAKATVTVTVTL